MPASAPTATKIAAEFLATLTPTQIDDLLAGRAQLTLAPIVPGAGTDAEILDLVERLGGGRWSRWISLVELRPHLAGTRAEQDATLKGLFRRQLAKAIDRGDEIVVVDGKGPWP